MDCVDSATEPTVPATLPEYQEVKQGEDTTADAPVATCSVGLRAPTASPPQPAPPPAEPRPHPPSLEEQLDFELHLQSLGRDAAEAPELEAPAPVPSSAAAPVGVAQANGSRNRKIVRSLDDAMKFWEDALFTLEDSDEVGALMNSLLEDTLSTAFSGHWV